MTLLKGLAYEYIYKGEYIMRFVEMIPKQLYIGGKIKASDLNFIYNNVTAIINLRTIPDQLPYQFNHLTMIWTPLTISSTPGIEWTIEMTQLIKKLIESEHTILLHDTIGIQRLGFVITAFYMKYFNLSRDQALWFIREKKPDIDPPPNYMHLLSEFEGYLSYS